MSAVGARIELAVALMIFVLIMLGMWVAIGWLIGHLPPRHRVFVPLSIVLVNVLMVLASALQRDWYSTAFFSGILLLFFISMAMLVLRHRHDT